MYAYATQVKQECAERAVAFWINDDLDWEHYIDNLRKAILGEGK